MTPEQFDVFLERNEKSTREAIEKTVNGKIDGIRNLVETHNEKHEADMLKVSKHIEEVAPILEAYNGTKALGNFAKWFAGIIVTVAAAWALIFKQ